MASALTDITRAMTTAIAPVFLITGVGGVLNAMATRYGRVIDRARIVLSEAGKEPQDAARCHRVDTELRRLYRRARMLRMTIILASSSIFCTSVTIFILFAAMTLEIKLPLVVAALFTASLMFLIASLAIFIQDFAISLGGLKYEIVSRLKRDPTEGADAKIIEG